MIQFILSRLVQSILVLSCILIVTFFILKSAPGSPFQDEKKIPEHVIEKTKEFYGLDRSVPVQLGKQFYNFFVKLDGGPSFANKGFYVSELIAESFPVSFGIAMGGLGIALLFGIPLGMYAASRQNTWVDYALMIGALIGICLPTFVTGPIFAQTLGIQFGWFDSAGWWDWRSWVLPSLTLGLFYAGYFARLTRGGMLDVLNQDYIRTARAKGVSTNSILFRHALRGGMLPSVTFMGPAIAGLVGGSFVVERVFAIPGQGTLFINAVINRDHPLIIGCVLVYGVLILVMNFLVDIALVILNPRLRGSATGEAA